MSDADNDNEENGTEKQTQQMTNAGLDPREIANLARLTDVLNREGVSVVNFGAITPTDYGVMFDLSLYIQTRAVPENAMAEPETDRAEDAGEVEAEVDSIVEEVGADGDDE